MSTQICKACKNQGWVLAEDYFDAAKSWPQSDLLATHQLLCPEDCARAAMIRTSRASLGLPAMKCVPVVAAEFERDRAFMGFAQALADAATSIALCHAEAA